MIWFSADHHFWHNNIIDFCNRPFGDPAIMNHKMIANWNEVVSKNDTVYYLGDFAICSQGRAKEILEQLNGKIHIILGNHDKQLRGLAHMFENSEEIFSGRLYPIKEISIEGQKVVMCHFPLLSWNGAYRGAIHLHGHSHNNIPDSPVKRLDVGVDGHGYYPISWERVKQIMAEKDDTAAYLALEDRKK